MHSPLQTLRWVAAALATNAMAFNPPTCKSALANILVGRQKDFRALHRLRCQSSLPTILASSTVTLMSACVACILTYQDRIAEHCGGGLCKGTFFTVFRALINPRTNVGHSLETISTGVAFCLTVIAEIWRYLRMQGMVWRSVTLQDVHQNLLPVPPHGC